MRYPKDHKRATRRRLVERAGSHAKKHGFNDSGMAALAASAGVTTGALYKHFDGKAELFGALIAAELERTAQMYGAIDPADSAGVARLLAGYLDLPHVRHPEQGCPLPSLTAEVARADASVRAAYQAGVLDIHAVLQRLTGTSDAAWTLMAQNVGAVMLARALPNEQLQKELLSALRVAAEGLLEQPSRPSSNSSRVEPVCAITQTERVDAAKMNHEGACPNRRRAASGAPQKTHSRER